MRQMLLLTLGSAISRPMKRARQPRYAFLMRIGWQRRWRVISTSWANSSQGRDICSTRPGRERTRSAQRKGDQRPAVFPPRALRPDPQLLRIVVREADDFGREAFLLAVELSDLDFRAD